MKLELEELDVVEGVEKDRRALSGRIRGRSTVMAAKEAKRFDEHVIEERFEEIYRGSAMGGGGGRARREEKGEKDGVG